MDYTTELFKVAADFEHDIERSPENVRGLAREIAANAPIAVQGMKRILRLLEASHVRGLSTAEREEIAGLRARAFESEDIREGRAAFEGRRWQESMYAGRGPSSGGDA